MYPGSILELGKHYSLFVYKSFSYISHQEKAKAKFDETVEAAIRLGIDPKRSDQVFLLSDDELQTIGAV